MLLASQTYSGHERSDVGEVSWQLPSFYRDARRVFYIESHTFQQNWPRSFVNLSEIHQL